jgi:D-3-phosphoglycerate dehydrogenase
MAMSNRPKVLIAAPVHTILTEGLTALGYECVFHEKITQAAAYALIADCAGVITSTRLQLDKDLLDAAPLLQWIGRMGSGMEVVDVAYATQRNIRCYSSPEGNCNAVGEHALGMLLSLIRRIGLSNNEMRDGIWQREENRGTELEGKTVGIIGYGHTGAAFAKKLLGFDVRILAYDKYNVQGVPEQYRCDTIEPILASADIISFHVPLQADTVNYCSAGFIGSVSKPFILINTSRGKVADLLAVHRGLKSGRLLGACLDVFEEEPPSGLDEARGSALKEMIALPNFVATPHIAGYTHEALYKMSKTLLDKIKKQAL